ncbi:HesB/IscA family protein [Paenactinomyces guangxiensis]|uniref:Iron-sulfur cluster assembly accessory protein n=1 Tax=Paenactinomyces guangxiensis TaxID=1490290 RepID=A0A7W1WPM3_9BACL|nr:iron-sulfur cluster assembly accessory protein [Paenactinomyces guangxiensis]MBA4493746.1 iron-sulfur cluster assembly accessory protein [Paenactinomyces guangxiensis]MBH8591034.1 iron-sulfur cluster assembly accessory protein [Paenactinomyces guangxiensis]
MITITERAALKVKDMLAEQDQPDKLYLRVGVQHGGCSGFSYSMGFDDEKKESDTELHLHGVKVLLDKESQPLLNGTVIDYKESMMGGGFSIENPNATVTCGCGSSFRTATAAGKPEDC